MTVNVPYNEFMGTDRPGFWGPFLLGLAAGGLGAAVVSRRPRRAVDPRLIKWPRERLTPVVVVPGIMGSGLERTDGTRVWLSWGNAVGSHELALPCVLPFCDSRDELLAAGLLGADALLPRLFGFTEYADLLDLLKEAGFERPLGAPNGKPAYHIFSYDWRRDLVESARALGAHLDALAERMGDPDVRFNLVGHSMGGLVARYYLRYGGADPREGMPVTWAGARRIENLVLVATPNAGSIASLDAIFNGHRVGFSTTTLASSVIARMPSIYQLLPPPGAAALVDEDGRPLDIDLHDPDFWRRRRWGVFSADPRVDAVTLERRQRFAEAALLRARAFHLALGHRPDTPCPVKVISLAGDCLPTLARGILPKRAGVPRFEPNTRAESAAMFEAGDGRVTRASVLARSDDDHEDTGGGVPEVSQSFFGSADHHGIYSEPTFQSLLLRLLLRPAKRALPESQADSLPSAG
jgi:pimeloyl-ACP methyl ester carboxylesterase